jgi:hypothetical protein
LILLKTRRIFFFLPAAFFSLQKSREKISAEFFIGIFFEKFIFFKNKNIRYRGK